MKIIQLLIKINGNESKKKKIGRLEFDVDYYVNKKSDVACPKRKLKLHLLIYNIIDYRV